MIPFLICLLDVIATPAAVAVPARARTSASIPSALPACFMVGRPPGGAVVDGPRTRRLAQKFERIFCNPIELLRASARRPDMTRRETPAMDELTTAAGSDRDLARAAQGGDAAALGLLFERHRTRLYAHALQHFGHGPDAQDAVQDTFVIAIRRIGALRDPDAVAGWLHTVLRSVCFSRLRGTRDVPMAALPEEPASSDETPEAAIEALALRDWVWTAIGRLSEPLRVVTMLRHFSATSSYEEIAAICGVPVGTVRSRLDGGRRGSATRCCARRAPRTATRPRSRRRSAGGASTASSTSTARCATTATSRGWPTTSRCRARAASHSVAASGHACVLEDAEAGVGFAPERVIAGPGITIVEARFVDPADDPFHCPPATTQVHFRANGLTHRQVWYPRRGPWPASPPRAAPAPPAARRASGSRASGTPGPGGSRRS
jgi:RNA polymerase sigma-70 factor (ECF subfamily)